MKKNLTILRMVMMLVAMTFPIPYANAWEWEWTDNWNEAVARCEECGSEYTFYAEDSDEAEEIAAEFFCEDCGSCSNDVNSDCHRSHHCQYCSDCIDNGEYHEGIYNKLDEYICYDCADELIETGVISEACRYCHEIFGEGAVECDCEYSMLEHHCTDCSELQCSVCGICLVIDGEDTEALTSDACADHGICGNCIADAAAEDLVHCRECFMCDEDICSECGLCESCAESEEHCPECGHCFGDEVQWCADGGEHCVFCCEDNEWKCAECGKCTEGAGLELCNDCGLCESCCHNNSESEGCEHGYCIASADYEDHLCPECGQCPQDEECEDCGLCQDCQQDYHCEHGLCPEGSEWDDHLCQDCGECFELDELCEYCGLCESCNEHCEHDICPLNDDEGDHFICEQCGDCYEGNQCDYCGLCEDCCHDNTVDRGCDHDLCVESDEFAEHWCYEDDQCLELCNHDADCAHLNVSTTWNMDGTAHWHVCQDCGIAMNKAIHTEGTPVTITSPNPVNHTNGTARISCSVCNTQMSIISIPYVEVPADGKPYILIQPTDYTGKTKSIDAEGPIATFKVKAGGENLSYQWYEKNHAEAFKPINDENGRTATLRVGVDEDFFDKDGYKQYYCVVTNVHGSVTTNTVAIKAQHLFGMYQDEGDGYHGNYCWGDCGTKKFVEKHRFAEWTLVRPATATATGLREQKCLLCEATNTEVIPKVEPGHVHSYDIAKHNITQHWFVCSCGLSDPNGVAEDHVFDQTVVITEPTEKKMGENEVTCSTCGYSKTVKVDKLPHTHDWYSFHDPDMNIWGPNGRLIPNPTMGGYGLETHHVKCKGCDQIKTEPHVWETWECTKAPKSEEEPGKMVRHCEECGYEQIKFYPFGSWPIMIEGGTANKDYATAGTQIIITFDPKAAKNMTHQDKPVKFKQWYDGTGWTGETNIPWDNGRTSIDLPRLNFQNPLRSTTQFIMPDGPATVVADTEECTHTGSTKQGERVEPTCGGYGHEPNTLCKDCGEVLEEGAHIPALGHDLPSTPIEGTEEVHYCTIRTNNQLTGFVEANIPNPDHTHGWSGDFLCNRCGETVKGKRTPLEHGLDYYISPYGTDLNWREYRNVVEATCTTDGYTGDVYCKFCGKLGERGERDPRIGHEWGEWQTIREATTKIKGMEQRICERDPSHIETRITDYSGPDYALRADKTKVKLEWTYGEQPATQTVTFKSTGRNEVLAVVGADESTIGGALNFSYDGMKLTIAPNMEYIWDMAGGVQLMTELWKVKTNEGEATNFTAPVIEVNFNIKKTTQKYTLTIVDGYASPTDARGNTMGNRSKTLQLRGGDAFRLERLDGYSSTDILGWEVINDASGLLGNELESSQWGVLMPPNNVTIRAIYKVPGDIVVSGTQVTNVNQANVLGDGTVSYVPKTKTMTLNNARIFGTEVEGISAKTTDLKINLTGHSIIHAGNTNVGMALRTTGNGPITFQGGGSLDIVAGGMGIVTWHDIVLKDGVRLAVESTGGNCGLQGRPAGTTRPTLTMSGSGTILMAKGGMASIQNFHAFDLSDGIAIIEPIGATFVEDVGVIGADNTPVANQWVIIANLEDYITSIKSISGSLEEGDNLYNLSGQRVSDSYKGIVIGNNKKVLKK